MRVRTFLSTTRQSCPVLPVNSAMNPFELFAEAAERILHSSAGNVEVIAELNECTGVLLRLCCGDQDVVSQLIRFNTLSTVSIICRSLTISQSGAISAAPVSEHELKVKKTLIVRLCRLMSNFTACGEAARSHLFAINSLQAPAFQPLSHILSAAVVLDNRNAVAATIGALYNCLQCCGASGDPCETAVQTRLEALCSSRPILCQILLSILPSNNGAPRDCTSISSSSAPPLQPPSPPETDPALEWFHLMAFLWVRRNVLYSIYSTVASTTTLTGTLAVTHEQLILVQLATGVMEDTYCTNILFDDSSHTATNTVTGLQVFLVQLIGDLVTVPVNTIFLPMDALDTSAEEDAVDAALAAIEHRMRRGLVQDFLPIALQLLASTLAVVPAASGRTLRAHLCCETPLLEWLVQLLCLNFAQKASTQAESRREKLAQATARPSNEESNTGSAAEAVGSTAGITSSLHSASPSTVVVDVERLRECTRVALQLLSNLVYGCDAAKDALRTSGALAAVLSHCGTDFENPISREWALLCVRNATEEHEGNQAFIQQLQPQEVVIQDERLRAQGMKVELSPVTGKFKFVPS